MTQETWQIVKLSVFTASISTLLILPFGVALAWLLARKTWRGKTVVETLVALPLVMPPVATGLILLKLLGRYGPVGQWLEKINLEVVFTWRGVVAAMAVMSFPLLVRSARIAFEEVNPRFEQVARTLGSRPVGVFFRVTLPLAFKGMVAGVVLAFARALGEFGATILVAGAIPGKTSTLSVSIYQLIQLGRDAEALQLMGISLILAFFAVWVSEQFLSSRRKPI